MNVSTGTWSIALIMAVCVRMAGAQESKPSTEAIPIVSVCQALQDRVQYHGKTIIVVGLMGGSDHGAWMNEKCEHTIVTDGFSWPNSISLAYATVTDAPLKFPSNFHWDEKLLGAKRKEIEKRTAAKRVDPDDTWYAIVGRFETRIPLQTVIAGGGRIMGFGFGHLNAAPAQLITDQDHRHELGAK